MLRMAGVLMLVVAAANAAFAQKVQDPKMTYQEARERLATRSLAIPDFWVGDVKDLGQRLQTVKRGEVSTIAKSPSGRPIHLVCYGQREKVEHDANFNSAIGGRDAAAYMNKAARKRPVVYFVGPVHGHEVEGLTGLMSLIAVLETGRDRRGKEQPELRRLADQCRLLIVPQANPDGIARFEPRSSLGMPLDELGFWGMGTWADDRIATWPTSKRLHPRIGPKVGFMGCYFDDAGVNPMHDEFFAPMSTEAPAILRVAIDEGPDLAVSLHSHGVGPEILRPAYVPLEVQAEAARLAERLAALSAARGLPYAKKFFTPVAEDKEPPASFNLVSALYHASGATACTFETPQGLIGFSPVTFEQMLDLQLTLYEAMLAHGLELKAKASGGK
jgi:hypothetical protein